MTEIMRQLATDAEPPYWQRDVWSLNPPAMHRFQRLDHPPRMAGSPARSCPRLLNLKGVQHAVNPRDIRVLVVERVERAGEADRVARVIALV